MGVVWWYTGSILALSGEEQAVVNYASTFARYSLIWLLPDSCFSAFSQWLNGQQKVKPTIWINVLFVFVNFGLNILLVFGWSAVGFGGLGFVGSPIATSLSKIGRGIVLVLYCVYVERLHEEVNRVFAKRRFTKTAVVI